MVSDSPCRSISPCEEEAAVQNTTERVALAALRGISCSLTPELLPAFARIRAPRSLKKRSVRIRHT